jgi:hypothetical protein
MSSVASGDVFNTATLQTPLGNTRDAINDIPLSAIRRHSLTDRQLPRLIPLDIYVAGMGVVGAHSSATTTETYSTYQASSLGDGTQPPDYQRFGSNGPSVPYGTPGAPDDGWRIPAINHTIVESARKAVTGAGYSPHEDTGEALRFTRCRLGVDLRSATTYTSHRYRSSVLLGIGVEDTAGNRYVFTNSVRWFSVQAVERGPISTSYMFSYDADGSTLTGAGLDKNDILAFFGVMSSRERIYSSVGRQNRMNPAISTLWFSAMPLMAEDLS